MYRFKSGLRGLISASLILCLTACAGTGTSSVSSIAGASATSSQTQSQTAQSSQTSAAQSSDTSSASENSSSSYAAQQGTITTCGGYEIELSALDHATSTSGVANVFYTSDISAASLQKIYAALGLELSGNTAVKITFGEGTESYNLDPALIEPLVSQLNGTLVDCNTAYSGNRSSTALHKQVAEDRGYTAIAPIDIMDENGSFQLSIPKATNLEYFLAGANIVNYDSMLVLSHFKGHAMAGFGGAMKNMAIGAASAEGKSIVHSGGTSHTGFGAGTSTITFTESLAEGASAVSSYFENKSGIVYINVMNNVSVDCDCDANPAKPDMHDVGIFASTDPVAVDQACVDMLYQVPDGQSVIERIHSRDGEHIFEQAEAIGYGSREYTLVSID